MTISELMTPSVVTVTLDDSLERIRRIFAESGFHHLLVSEGQRIAGIISDRDLLRHLSPFAGTPSERAIDAAALRKRAHQIMTRDPVTASPGMEVGAAARLMLDRRVSCLPVVEGGRCLGIVTVRDLLRVVASGG
jgi:acetoin utilization protein AcuB